MVVHNNILAGASGVTTGAADYQISRSLRFSSGDSSYLSRTPSSAGNRKTWTWSGWVKRSSLSGSNFIFGAGSNIMAGGAHSAVLFQSDSKLQVYDYSGSAYAYRFRTTRVFRDPSAWYHLVVAIDTTQSAQTDRVKLYINGDLQDSFDQTTYPSQNYDSYVNTSSLAHQIGHSNSDTFDGYLTEVYFIDGQQLAASDFGEYDDNNVWQAKRFTGTYNTARSFASYPAVTISPSVIGGGNVTHVNGGGTYFYSQAQTGAGSIKVEFSSPITGVTSIKMNGGGYAVGSTYHIKLNGSDVLTNLTTASGWAQVEHTISSTDISSFEIYTTNAGWSLYNLLFNDTSPSGTASLVIPAGVNGFHLDFSDNSSKAALGINTATADDFTSTVGALTTTQAADFYTAGSYPPNNFFDGSTSTIMYGGYNSTSTNSDLIWTPSGAYSASSSLRVYAGYYSTIYVNGVSKATGGESSAPSWVTLSHTGSITSIKFENTSNSNVVRAAAIEVDGTIVETTAWTVNNLAVAGSAWDQSQTWSSLGTGTAYNNAYDWDKAFNGVITTTTDNAFGASDATMTWTPSSAITVNTSVTLYVYNPTDGSSYGTRVNGSYITGTNNYNVPVTLTAATLGGQLTSIQLTNSSLVGPYLGGVEVDGVLLVDSGIADPELKNIDSLIDTPTNYEATASGNNGGNYATFNPLDKHSSLTISDGNLKVQASTTQWEMARSTFFLNSGKHYWEFTWNGSVTGTSGYQMGLKTNESTLSAAAQQTGSYAFQYTSIYQTAGSNNTVTISPGSTTSGDTVMFAYDADTGKMWIGVNGSWNGSGNPATGANPDWTSLPTTGLSPFAGCYGTQNTITLNAGQRSFSYTPPTGFKSLCTTNLPDPTIADGSTAFDAKTFTANNGSQSISLGFSPDLVWTKSRANAYEGQIFDIVRGNNQEISPSSSRADRTLANSLTFDSSGFTIPSNNNNANYGSSGSVAWAWDAGSSNTSISSGDLNSSIYDRSKVWTSLVTTSSLHSSYNSYGPNSKLGCFDGKRNTSMYSASGPLTITFDAQAFPASGGPYFVEVQTNQRGIKVNGQPSSGYTTDIASGQATYWANNGSVSSLTSVEINQANAAYGGMTNQIRVNGKILADPVNDSVTWSSSLSGLSGSSLTNPSNAFDTDESTYADSTAGFTLDLSGHTFGTGAHTIEVKSGGATSFTVNGSTSLSGSGSGAIVWTGTHTGELTSLASSATGASVYYIKIDGEYLLDPGQDFVDGFPTIASTVRANPSSGLSIVSYTGNGTAGATVGHGLNSKPDMILHKSRGDTQNWMVYHSALGATKAIFLSTSDPAATSSVYFNNTEPTSSVWSLGTRNGINLNTDPMIAYCFSAVEGYSAFGKFSGNSSTDGPFQFCGFKPRFLLLKGVTQARNWIILDTARDAGNVGDSYLHPDTSGAEGTYAIADILSNGFKMRYNGGLANQTGEDYIWAAFASHPFKTARAR